MGPTAYWIGPLDDDLNSVKEGAASKRCGLHSALSCFLHICIVITFLAAVLLSTAPEAEAATKPVIYLTFDDGPGTDTNQFLDLLEGHNIHATFFVTGRAVIDDPVTAQRIVNDGHAVANHTWNHPSLSQISDGRIVSELGETTKAIRATTGVTPTCYRPPYGATSGRVHRVADSMGLANERWVTAGNHRGLWDIDTGDWRLSRSRSSWSPSAMMQQLNRASDGDTILMHDGPSNRSRGYQVLADWLAVNRVNFDFQPLPGCGGVATELSINPDAPELWPRFQIGRLYKAYFDRQADDAGAEYWTRTYADGVSLEEISGYFAASSEFRTSGTLNDQQFVAFVYSAVLDRQPDTDGADYWLSQLATGAVDRGSLLVYFSESAEHIARTASELTQGCYSGDVSESYLCLSANVDPYD